MDIEFSITYNITLTEGALLIFLQYGVEKLLPWTGFEPTTLDLSYKSDAFDLSTTALHLIVTNLRVK